MACRLRTVCTFSLSVAALTGCSVLIDPDPDALGGSSDVTLPDMGPGPMADGGPGADGGPAADGGPGPDLGPSDCPAPPRCQGDTRVVCADGELLAEPCPAGCDAATAECIDPPTGFTPSNVGTEYFGDPATVGEFMAGAYEYDTADCPNVATMRDGGEACVLSYGSFVLAEGAYLRVSGWRPLIVMAETVQIDGIIDVSARGTEGGPGGFDGVTGDMVDGLGAGAGSGGAHDFDYDDGGGGGAGGCGAGGDGGSGGRSPGGNGGSAWLLGSDLQPLGGGSSGGRGRGVVAVGNAGTSGGGGGAIQITARESLVLNGGIVAGGGGGGGGQNNGDRGTNWGSGGGGGAGGNVILEAPAISGSGGVSVVGGGGGGGASSRVGGDGQNGIDAATGRPSGGESGGTQYGASGAAGAGLGSMVGGDGAVNDTNGANGGGGGGGSGCLVIRTEGAASVAVNPGAGSTVLPLLP